MALLLRPKYLLVYKNRGESSKTDRRSEEEKRRKKKKKKKGREEERKSKKVWILVWIFVFLHGNYENCMGLCRIGPW